MFLLGQDVLVTSIIDDSFLTSYLATYLYCNSSFVIIKMHVITGDFTYYQKQTTFSHSRLVPAYNDKRHIGYMPLNL